MDDLVLALDLGTGTVKAGLFAPGDDRPVALAAAAYAMPSVPGHPECAEVDPALWAEAASRATSELPADLRKHVQALGVTGLYPALVAMDGHGRSLGPAILYGDRRSTREVCELRAQGVADLVERISGSTLSTGTPSLSSWLWLRRHDPDVFRAARWFGGTTTWFGAWCTGVFGIEGSNASMTGLFDLRSGVWSQEVAQAVETELDRWPPLVEMGKPLGCLRPEPAAALGLRPGLPVVLAGGDSACAALGCGCVQPGACFLSSGTTDTLCLVTEGFDFDPRLYRTAHLVPGLFLSMAPTLYTGGSIDWAAKLLFPQEPLPTEAFLEAASGVPAGAGGLVFLPYLLGERSPIIDPQARAVFFGLTAETDREGVARAVVDGTSLAIRDCLDALTVHAPRPTTMRIAGRPAASELLNQARASACGLPVEALDFPEGALLGAAAQAALGAGMVRDAQEMIGPYVAAARRFEPKPQDQACYEELLGIYRDLYQAARGADLFRRLGALPTSSSLGTGTGSL